MSTAAHVVATATSCISSRSPASFRKSSTVTATGSVVRADQTTSAAAVAEAAVAIVEEVVAVDIAAATAATAAAAAAATATGPIGRAAAVLTVGTGTGTADVMTAGMIGATTAIATGERTSCLDHRFVYLVETD
jgi:hypothetical protein